MCVCGGGLQISQRASLILAVTYIFQLRPIYDTLVYKTTEINSFRRLYGKICQKWHVMEHEC